MWINRYVSYDFMIRVVLNIIPKLNGGLSIHKTEYKIVWLQIDVFYIFRYEDITDHTGIKVLKSPIQFEPPELDFKEQ